LRHHLLIGGTGRAGTTFLVEYLAACGLETHLAKNPNPFYDEDANAGLEDSSFGDANQPYVLKSPWMYQYVKRLLNDSDIAVDGVIIPMRGIVEAATSRVVNELRGRYANESLPDDLNRWESWGTTAGGVTYSLNPLDQARLLAMGFHELMDALVKHDIPVVLLDFPRFIGDANYLYQKLQPLIGDKVKHATALGVHRAVADPSKVRVGRELVNNAASESALEGNVQRPAVAFPSHAMLDRIALRRELDKSRGRTAQMVQQLAEADAREQQMTLALNKAQAQIAQLIDAVSNDAVRTGQQREALELTRQRVAALENSRSWRLTALLRAVSRLHRH